MPERTYSVLIKSSRFSHKFYRGKLSGHAFVPGCNFKCNFCGVRAQDILINFKPITQEQIRNKLTEVRAIDGSIKIGGQEATLSPGTLNFVAQTAKDLGCEVIIDTNGSNPEQILSLARQGMIDQVEVGIKGFSREEAINTSGAGNGVLCWENPFRLIRQLTHDHPGIKVLASFVIWQNIADEVLSAGFSQFNAMQRNNMFIRFTNVEDPIPDNIINFLLKREKAVEETAGPDDNKSRSLLKQILSKTYGLRMDLLPLPESEMIDRIRAITKGTFWEGRVILVLNRTGHVGENGTEGLAWI